jgi:hypothetical protein
VGEGSFARIRNGETCRPVCAGPGPGSGG